MEFNALDTIKNYITASSGLYISSPEMKDFMSIVQDVDGKIISFETTSIEQVLERVDADGKLFLQINFNSGKKILLTDELIGFKPIPIIDLDMSKLPKVVTTPDLISVLEAIEEVIHLRDSESDVDVLKKLYISVLEGAESVGFDLTEEKIWLQHLNYSGQKATA